MGTTEVGVLLRAWEGLPAWAREWALVGAAIVAVATLLLAPALNGAERGIRAGGGVAPMWLLIVQGIFNALALNPDKIIEGAKRIGEARRLARGTPPPREEGRP